MWGWFKYIFMEIYKDALTYNDQRYDVHYFEAENITSVPDELVVKAHGVCFWDGKMLLVNHPQWNVWAIPGGTREQGESIEEALIREILEESNCRVVDMNVLGYKKIIAPDGSFHYRAQYICAVEPVGEFEFDVAGNINKIIWINPCDYKDYIEEKGFREVVVRRAVDLYEKKLKGSNV